MAEKPKISPPKAARVIAGSAIIIGNEKSLNESLEVPPTPSPVPVEAPKTDMRGTTELPKAKAE
jgi:hypothetical protein